MSNIALSWAFRCHVGNASAKAVLVYLADRASDDGTAAFPKIETIVNVTELSERTVRSSLKLLQERGFIRRGDQRYARLGKGGRTRLPQYCQIVWDLAVESDPATLTWIKETHAAEQDISTMSETVAPEAGIVPENDESKDVLPENVGTKPISSTANLAGLENDSKPALQISHPRHCKSRTSGSANVAGLLYKDKTLHENPPCEPHPSLPSGELPASGKRPAGKDGGNDSIGASEVVAVISHLASVRSKLSLTTAEPTKRDLDRTGRLIAPDRRSQRERSSRGAGAHPRRHRLAAREHVLARPHRLRTTAGRQLGRHRPTTGPSASSNANANATPRPGTATAVRPRSPLQCRTATRTATCIRSCANTCSPT